MNKFDQFKVSHTKNFSFQVMITINISLMSKRMLSSHVDEAVEEVAVIVEALEVEAEEV